MQSASLISPARPAAGEFAPYYGKYIERVAEGDIAATLGLNAKPAGNGWVDLAPRAGQQVLMPLVAEGRGRRGLPPIRLETQHPFGLVVVSASWAPRADLLVRARPALPRV